MTPTNSQIVLKRTQFIITVIELCLHYNKVFIIILINTQTFHLGTNTRICVYRIKKNSLNIILINILHSLSHTHTTSKRSARKVKVTPPPPSFIASKRVHRASTTIQNNLEECTTTKKHEQHGQDTQTPNKK